MIRKDGLTHISARLGSVRVDGLGQNPRCRRGTVGDHHVGCHGRYVASLSADGQEACRVLSTHRGCAAYEQPDYTYQKMRKFTFLLGKMCEEFKQVIATAIYLESIWDQVEAYSCKEILSPFPVYYSPLTL